MKCILCGGWNLVGILCPSCFPPLSLGVRLADELSVYSFYALSEVELLIHCKYMPVGSRIYSLLAQKASEYFLQNAHLMGGAFGIGVDDRIKKGGYSHTGVIVKAFKRCGITPIYGALKAQSDISYAGQSLQFRLSNPKRFKTQLKGKSLILFDDVITTGETIKEATRCLRAQDNEVLFALTLCDARR